MHGYDFTTVNHALQLDEDGSRKLERRVLAGINIPSAGHHGSLQQAQCGALFTDSIVKLARAHGVVGTDVSAKVQRLRVVD